MGYKSTKERLLEIRELYEENKLKAILIYPVFKQLQMCNNFLLGFYGLPQRVLLPKNGVRDFLKADSQGVRSGHILSMSSPT